MSLTSKMVIILQLATWNAVGIVLLQKGVSSLRRKMLDTTDQVTETNLSISLDIESTVSSMMIRTENEYDQELIEKNAKLIIQINPELHLRDNRNHSELNALTSVLRNTLEIISKKDSFGIPTINQETPSWRVENHLTETDRRIGYSENKSRSSKISRIARDRERILSNSVSKNIHAEEDISSESVMEPVSEEIDNYYDEEEKDSDFAEHTSRPIIRESTTETSFSREKTDNQVVDSWRNKNRITFSRLNDSGAAAAIAMVTIGIIMLLLGPAVIILRILEERKRAREMVALSVIAREDSPPTYEQAVFMSEAPRYSTLALNDDRRTPSPPPSPAFIPNFVVKSHST